MQQDQIKGMLDRAIAIIATTFLGWLVKKGYIGESDSATLLPAIILLPSLAWGWWRNRNTRLLQSAAAVVGPNGEKTVVIAPTAVMADAVPEKNVVATVEEAKEVVK